MTFNQHLLNHNLQDQHFCVLGAAKSGISAALLLKKQGAQVFVSDAQALRNEVKTTLVNADITYEENGHQFVNQAHQENHVNQPNKFQYMIVSPGIAPSAPVVLKAKEEGALILSEINLGLSFLRPNTKLVGITGTNGKSTTTHFCAHLLNAGGLKTYACGNIGIPLSEIVNKHDNYEALCIELSSYQLEYGLNKIFDVTMLLNLQNDHLQRHQTFENYLRAKWNLVLATKDDGICLIEKSVYEMAQKLNFPMPSCQIITNFSDAIENLTKIEHLKDLASTSKNLCLMGNHNAQNIACAKIAASHFKLSEDILLKECLQNTSQYQPLAHRLEKVYTHLSQTFINDSKATNVESTLVALKAIEKPLRLLLGGVPKGDSYLPISEFFDKNLIRVYPFGEAGHKIYEELKEFNHCVEEPIKSMESALNTALLQSNKEDVILLSPACSSFDEFENFEHRGNAFKEWVKQRL